jgi:hypothetical protein
MSAIQALNPRFSGEGAPDVENPTGKSEMPPVRYNDDEEKYDNGMNPKTRVIGLVVIVGVVLGACAYLLAIPPKEAATTPKAPTLPTSAPTLTPAPTLSPTGTPDVIITFAPEAALTNVSAPYQAKNEVNTFEVENDGYVTVEFASGNLENGFDTLEIWNKVDVNVAGKLPLKVLTGAKIKAEEPITTTQMGGMTLKVSSLYSSRHHTKCDSFVQAAPSLCK